MLRSGHRYLFGLLVCQLIFWENCARAQSLDLQNAIFVASKRWFQLSGDNRIGIFRAYAALTANDRGVVDLPNILLLNCESRRAYLTLHFPPSYPFKGFTPTTWLPKTEVFVRVASGTFRFQAELNKNEFHIDLTDDDFNHLIDIWDSPLIEAKVGPAMEDVRIALGDQTIDAATRDLLAKNLPPNKRVENDLPFEAALTTCLSKQIESPTGRYWKVWGMVRCVDCGSGSGRTYSYMTIGSNRDGLNIRSEQECLKAKAAFELVASKSNLKPYMHCLRVENPK
jgi:hypothetical protein